TLGCGAFLYLYWIALHRRGLGCQLAFFPEGAPEPAARLDARPLATARIIPLEDDGELDHFFAHIAERRTNRNAYDARIPDEAALAAIGASAHDWMDDIVPSLSAHWTAEPQAVARLRDLVWRAFDRELRTRGAQEETYTWLRFGAREVAEHRDGLAIDAPMAPLLKATGLLSREAFLDPDSFANKQAAEDWKRKADTAPAFMWLSTPEDTPQARLIAGMAYARMNLAATAQGLAMHPWSQALQEYAEMADLYAETRELLGAGERTLQMLVRVGYADPVGPAARRDIEAFVRA
ncbi:MAG: Acg family FMN-binding oxidoreductase, partial [Vitreimonas sp.]